MQLIDLSVLGGAAGELGLVGHTRPVQQCLSPPLVSIEHPHVLFLLETQSAQSLTQRIAAVNQNLLLGDLPP